MPEIPSQHSMGDEKGQHACGICGGSLDSGDHSACQTDKVESTLEQKLELTDEQQDGLNQMIKWLQKGYIDTALNIRETLSLPDEVLQSDEVQSAAMQGMIEHSYYFDIGDLIRNREQFSLTEAEVQSAAKKGMIEKLLKGPRYDAFRIVERFSLPEEVIQSDEVQSAAKQGMIETLLKGPLYDALEIKEKYSLPEEFLQSDEVKSAAKQGIIAALSNGDIKHIFEIKEKFSLPDESLQSDEARSTAMQGMIKKLSEGQMDVAFQIKEKFSLTEAEVQSTAMQGMIKSLSLASFDSALKIKEKFSLPETEAKSAAIQVMIGELYSEKSVFGRKIKEKFSLTEAEVQSAAKQGIIRMLNDLQIETALKIKEKYSLPEEVLQSDEVQSAAIQSMIAELLKRPRPPLAWNQLHDALIIKEHFSIPEEVLQSDEVQSAAIQSMINMLSVGDISDVLRIKEKFSLPDESLQSDEARSTAMQGMIKKLSEGQMEVVYKIKEIFSLPEEVLQSDEARSAAMLGMILSLGINDINNAFKIIEQFSLPEAEVQSAAKQVIIGILSNGYILHALEIKEKFSLPEAEAQSAATQGMIENLSKGQTNYALEIKEKFSLPDQKVQEPFCNFIENAISDNNLNLVLPHLDRFPSAVVKQLEPKHFLSSYRNDLNLASADIYTTYRTLKQAGDEMQITGFIEKMKESLDSLISNNAQNSEITEMEHYQSLIEATYPNHANNWTNYKSNESCADRSADIEQFVRRDKYIVDLSEGVDMVLAPGQTKDGTAVANLEKPITSIQQKFSEVGFDKEKMFDVLDKEIDEKLANVPQKEIFTSREEKLYGLLLESLIGKANPEDLKELLIGYQFAEFEDIKTYLEGTRAQAEQAKNPDYAYLLELREFFADHLKEVERKIAKEAEGNPDIAKRLPDYYQKKKIIDAGKVKQETLNRLQISKLGLDGNLLERIAKELGKKTDSKGNAFSLGDRDDEGNLVPGKKSEALAGMILAEQKKAAKAIVAVTGKEVQPESIHLGELNLAEYLDAQHMLKSGEYDEELFSRYLLQAFQGIFEKELTIIDREVAKYKPKDEELKGKKQKKLECFITKNHTSAHARGVGGVCVSGDNPSKGAENQWDMPNYFQMVLRDAESKVCQGLVLLHYYEDKGKKILTASLNPSSTYLYQVDEQQLFKGLLKQLEVFATDNGIDTIAISQNKSMRTNRTGGEFERAMDNRIRSVQKTESLTREETFSYHPNYTQQKLDVVWQKGVE